MKRLSESLISSRLFMINMHGTVSAATINVIFIIFVFVCLSHEVCLSIFLLLPH